MRWLSLVITVLMALGCRDKPSPKADPTPVKCDKGGVPDMEPGWGKARWGVESASLPYSDTDAKKNAKWRTDKVFGLDARVGFLFEKDKLWRVEIHFAEVAAAELESEFRAISKALRAEHGAPAVELATPRLERWVGGTCGEKLTQITHQLVREPGRGLIHRLLYDDFKHMSELDKPNLGGTR